MAAQKSIHQYGGIQFSTGRVASTLVSTVHKMYAFSLPLEGKHFYGKLPATYEEMTGGVGAKFNLGKGQWIEVYYPTVDAPRGELAFDLDGWNASKRELYSGATVVGK